MDRYEITEQFEELIDEAISNLSVNDLEYVLKRLKEKIKDIESI